MSIIKEKINKKKVIKIDESLNNIIGIRMENNELKSIIVVIIVERKVINKRKEEIINTKTFKTY